jgi:hypothetical protein
MNARQAGAARLSPLSQECTCTLIDDEGAEHTVHARFDYDTVGASEVSFVLGPPDDESRWQVSRAHLADSLYEPSGSGGVHLWPTTLPSGTAVVSFELSDGDAVRLVLVPSRDIAIFVALTRASDADRESLEDA